MSFVEAYVYDITKASQLGNSSKMAGIVLIVLGKGYKSKSGYDKVMKTHIASLCQYLYFTLM